MSTFFPLRHVRPAQPIISIFALFICCGIDSEITRELEELQSQISHVYTVQESVQYILSEYDTHLAESTDTDEQPSLQERLDNILENCNNVIRRISIEKIKLRFKYILNLVIFLKC